MYVCVCAREVLLLFPHGTRLQRAADSRQVVGLFEALAVSLIDHYSAQSETLNIRCIFYFLAIQI
jgi:hypothetical protein